MWLALGSTPMAVKIHAGIKPFLSRMTNTSMN
jgi:hypothetical protein